MTHHTVRTAFILCAITSLMVTREGNAQGVELKPNLVALPASELSVVIDSTTGEAQLRFSTMSWNNGTGPLELGAGTIDLNQLTRKVYQRVYRSDGTSDDYLAGDFVYHPAHAHFHFEDYALYRLVPVNAPGASERQSAKTTFCVMDTNKIPNSPGPAFAVYASCGADVQGMSVGWADRYGAHLAGQSFDVTNSPDGDYDLMINIDPRLRILESNESDNSACVRIRLNVSSRSVQTLGSCTSPGNVSVTSITPNFGYQGTLVHDVKIAGSGFVPGMAVGFENGSGPAPVASDVQYIDANNITLTVTVKSNGPKRERLWDVRVGPAVLPKGFTVRP